MQSMGVFPRHLKDAGPGMAADLLVFRHPVEAAFESALVLAHVRLTRCPFLRKFKVIQIVETPICVWGVELCCRPIEPPHPVEPSLEAALVLAHVRLICVGV